MDFRNVIKDYDEVRGLLQQHTKIYIYIYCHLEDKGSNTIEKEL
jgi:hypothetical protein